MIHSTSNIFEVVSIRRALWRRRQIARPSTGLSGTTFRLHPSVEVMENRALLSDLPMGGMTGRELLSVGQFPVLTSPRAALLTDLTGDGIRDLTVADRGRSVALIYRGLPNGKLSPPLAIDDAFPTAADPLGIAAVDLTGDGLPEVVIARKGSADALILHNHSEGDNLAFTAGLRLNSGSGPVSIVVSDFDGNGVPDILVDQEGPDGIILLLGVTGAVFNADYPVLSGIASPARSIPASKLADSIDTAPVEIETSEPPQIAPVPGPDPSTAAQVTGDLMGLALALAFGSARAGSEALFDAGSRGAGSLLTGPGLFDLIDPSLVASDGNESWFSAAPALGVWVGIATQNLGTDWASANTAFLSSNTAGHLVPLEDSWLALIATVPAFATPLEHELVVVRAQTDFTMGAAFLPGASAPSGGQTFKHAGDVTGKRAPSADPADTMNAGRGSASTSTMSWERFVIGLDEALEDFHREGRQPVSSVQDWCPGNERESLHPPAERSSRDGLERGSGQAACVGTDRRIRLDETETTRPSEASPPLVATVMFAAWILIARSTGVGRSGHQSDRSSGSVRRSGRSSRHSFNKRIAFPR
jgi:hypothetical protein